jgi:hypothetical protein
MAAISTSPSSARRTADCTEATPWVTRTAPTGRPSWMIGAAVARICAPSVLE